jgi:hypothetical protein
VVLDAGSVVDVVVTDATAASRLTRAGASLLVSHHAPPATRTTVAVRAAATFKRRDMARR